MKFEIARNLFVGRGWVRLRRKKGDQVIPAGNKFGSPDLNRFRIYFWHNFTFTRPPALIRKASIPDREWLILPILPTYRKA
jgi:hypothetical protein